MIGVDNLVSLSGGIITEWDGGDTSVEKDNYFYAIYFT